MSEADLPVVSVVIATNRRGPFLQEALTSLRDQTYSRIEAVLVDDGSPDAAALETLVRPFPAVTLVRQVGAGVAVARNNGVMRTTGELIAFLDDDDRWHPERIRRQAEVMDRHPNAVLSYGALRTVDDAGRELVTPDQTQVRDIHDILRRRTGIIAPNIMVRRETFLRVGGFHPAFRRAQDLDLVLKAAHEGEFVFVPDAIVDYRHHRHNNTRQHRQLCRSIDHVLRLHRWAAWEQGGATWSATSKRASRRTAASRCGASRGKRGPWGMRAATARPSPRWRGLSASPRWPPRPGSPGVSPAAGRGSGGRPHRLSRGRDAQRHALPPRDKGPRDERRLRDGVQGHLGGTAVRASRGLTDGKTTQVPGVRGHGEVVFHRLAHRGVGQRHRVHG